MCAQEAAFEARGPGADQGDHAEGEPRGHLSGRLHSRSGSAQTRVHVQVCSTTHAFGPVRRRRSSRGSTWSLRSPGWMAVSAGLGRPPWVGGQVTTSLASSLFCRYWHRSLNPRKLVEVKFSHLSRNMTLQRTMKLYRLPDVSSTHPTLTSPLHNPPQRRLFLSPRASRRARRLRVCGQWRGATSARSQSCYRNS